MWTLVVAALVAPPPIGDFPAEIRPKDGSVAPRNTALWAIGDPAPTPDQVGITADVNGAPHDLLATGLFGCCVLRAEFDGAPTEGDTVDATVSSAAGDVTSHFTIGPEDNTAPTFVTFPQAIDDGPSVDGNSYEIIIGVEVDDESGIGMIYAQLDDPAQTVVGSSADGYILRARVPGHPTGELCVQVSALDVAGNSAFPARDVCVTVAEGEGEGDATEGEGEGEGDTGCASAPVASLVALLAAIKRRSLKERRAGPAA